MRPDSSTARSRESSGLSQYQLQTALERSATILENDRQWPEEIDYPDTIGLAWLTCQLCPLVIVAVRPCVCHDMPHTTRIDTTATIGA